MQDILLLVGGLVTLVLGADILVRGAVWCALALGLSPMMVGLTLIAFGTSAPELVVALFSAFDGKPGFATGSVLGSNIANIGLIVGIAAMVKPIEHVSGTARFEVRFTVLAAVAPLLILAMADRVDRVTGVLLLLSLAWFTLALIHRERRKDKNSDARVDKSARALAVHLAFLIGGFAGLIYGGDWLVQGATGIAAAAGLSDVVIGMTVIAIGTSLPELATSLVAASRGHPEIALGNVLGSNVFNVFMVLGATAVVQPIPVAWSAEGPAAGLGLVFAVCLGLLLRRGVGISRRAGLVLVLTYAGYLAWSVLQS